MNSLSNSFLSFVHPEDIEITVHEIEKLSHGYLTINFENRFQKIRWFIHLFKLELYT